MGETYLYALGSVAAVSLISVIGIITLSIKESVLHRVLFIVVSVAAGALFGDAIIHLIPEAFESAAQPSSISLAIIAGIIVFFILEKFLRWKHTHDVDNNCIEGVHGQTIAPDTGRIKPVGHLVIVSDAVHNFIDGIVIGVSYLISTEVGIATTIAVVLHEIPQEIGDFGLLVHAGFSRMKALFVNFLSALFAIIGTIIALIIGKEIEIFIPLIAAFAAGNFLYIAGSDLLPEIHQTSHPGRSFIQLLSLIAGIGIMFALLLLD